MSERPKEIWCDTGLYWEYKTDWSEGSWRDNDNCGGEKYVRADRIEELEAKLAKANDRIEELEAELDYWRKDSAAAWDTCEENRVKLAKADQELEFADHLFRSVDGWLKFGNTTIHSIRCAVNAYAKKRTTLAELTGGEDE